MLRGFTRRIIARYWDKNGWMYICVNTYGRVRAHESMIEKIPDSDSDDDSLSESYDSLS